MPVHKRTGRGLWDRAVLAGVLVAGGWVAGGAAATVPSAVVAPPAPAPALTPEQSQADIALAACLSAEAQNSFPQKVTDRAMWDPLWQSAAAELSASCKLDPRNARLARLAVDATGRLGDSDALLKALYAAHAAGPADQFTTIRILDLYVSRMQTSQAKLKYLKDQLANPALPLPVQSHAGVLAAEVLLERGEPDASATMLDQAIRLNPANGEALRLRYANLPVDASAYQRTRVLLDLLRANPGQPAYTTALADLLAAHGLSHEAIPWYQLTITLTAAAGQADLRAAQDCAAELLLADQEPDAASLAQQLVQADPNNLANWFLKLAVIHGNISNDEYLNTLQQARNTAGNALATAAAAASGGKPTTRPVVTAGAYPLPDLSGSADHLHATTKPAAPDPQQDRFVAAAVDFATLELIYAHDATAAAPAVAALAKVLPATDPRLLRVQGWTALLANDRATAKQQLSAAAEADPFSALGLVKLGAGSTSQPADPTAERLAGSRLLSAHPGMLIGALLFDQLRDTQARAALSPQASAVQSAVQQFPMTWLDVLSRPSNFYVIQIDPIDVARSFGQPLLANLTIQNVGDLPLPIGTDGVLHRGVAFSAEIRGITDKHFPAVAYDELAGPVVLAPRQTMSQIIRLDQGALWQYLWTDPTVAMQVYGTAVSNPAGGIKGEVQPSVGGYSAEFSKVFGRIAAPAGSPEATQAHENVSKGTPEQKIFALQLISREVELLRASGTPASLSQIPLEMQLIRGSQADPLPAVAAFARYTALRAVPPDQAGEELDQMVESPDWRLRLLAMVGLPRVPASDMAPAAARLQNDPEPSVKSLALARLALSRVPAHSPPATTPSR